MISFAMIEIVTMMCEASGRQRWSGGVSMSAGVMSLHYVLHYLIIIQRRERYSAQWI